MAGAVLAIVFGLWLIAQAVPGRLSARILSRRQFRPGELPDQIPAGTPPLGAPPAPSAAGVLSIDQVAQLALSVGLTPDQAVIATAIAMRESGGNPAAHNGPNATDDSWGLWQINVLPQANPQFKTWNLTDPQVNAKAMLELSRHGTNWSPWQIGGNPLAHTDVPAARAAVDRVLRAMAGGFPA